MNPTLRDLRAALEDEAISTPLPSPDAVVAGAARRVRVTRRRRATAGGALAALVLAAGLVATGHLGRQPPEPARTGPFRVVPSGGDFPAYLNGTKRRLVVTAPALEKLKGTLDVPTTPGRLLSVRLVCRPTTITDFDQRTLAKVTGPGGDPVQAACLPNATLDPNGTALGTVESSHTPVDLDVFVNHDEFRPGAGPSFKDATVSVAVYESVPWQDYPKPPRPAGFDTDPDRAWNPPEDPKAFVLGPSAAEEANTPRAATILADRPGQQSLTLETRGPGRLRLKVNGTEVTDDVTFGPRVEDGWLEFFDYTANGIGVDLRQHTSRSQGGKLRIEVIPEGFTGADWRVVVGRQP